MVLILKDKLSGIITGPGNCTAFPYTDIPTLPPRVSDIELWQFYLRKKFVLREEDFPFLIPVRDCGKSDPKQDFTLFSAEEQLFWHKQISYVISRYKGHRESMMKPTPLQHTSITYNLTGTGARVNVDSIDLSVNKISVENSNVFAQVRDAVAQIPDLSVREEIEQIVNEMERAHGSSDFLQKYQAFVTAAANHITILGPVIPALSGLLG
ncbi:putative pANL2 [Pusillimonas sp. T7-7]|nr:putative pANL2 [Pusillimonas sp. T7-7]